MRKDLHVMRNKLAETEQEREKVCKELQAAEKNKTELENRIDNKERELKEREAENDEVQRVCNAIEF